MPKFNADDNTKAAYSLLPQALATGANNGSGVDCKGYGEALVVFIAGATTSNGSHAAKVQESSDNGVADPFADVAGAAFTAVTTSNDNAIYVGRINIQGRERYLRVLDTGTNQTMLGAAVIILSQPQYAPVTQENTVAFSV